MERVTDHQFALIDGKLRHLPRGVEEYLELADEREATQSGDRRQMRSRSDRSCSHEACAGRFGCVRNSLGAYLPTIA